jgi:MFS family permease
MVSLLGASYATLIPVFAGHILQGGPQTLGLLMGSSGAGALLGATWLAGRRSVLGLGSLIPCATALFGLSIIGFALSRLTWLSMIFLFAGGLGLMVQMAASNTILQTIVGDTMRSRVMSFYMMAFLGTAPFGSLLMGSMSERFGPTLAIALGGVSCLVGAGVFFSGLEQLRESIRPIYRRMGILPELANAEEAASQIAFQARE